MAISCLCVHISISFASKLSKRDYKIQRAAHKKVQKKAQLGFFKASRLVSFGQILHLLNYLSKFIVIIIQYSD